MAAGVVPDCIKINIPGDALGTKDVLAESSATTGSDGGTKKETSVAFIVTFVASVPVLLVTLKSIFDGTVLVETVLFAVQMISADFIKSVPS